MDNERERSKAVAAVAWPWKERETAAPATRSGHRGEALVNFAIGGSIGLVLLAFFHKTILGTVVLCVSAALLACSLWIPGAHAGIKRAMAGFAAMVGTALTWLLLTPFFYICFTTGRLAQLLTGKDPLRRRFPAPGSSTWVPVPPVRDAAHYRKQY